VAAAFPAWLGRDADAADSEFLLGGQAVYEGVMMRGPRKMAVAVRREDGDIALWERDLPVLSGGLRFLRWPVLRGMRAIWLALVLGMQGLSKSAELFERGEEDGEAEPEGRWAMALTMVLAFALGIGIFFFLPLGATQLLSRWWAPVGGSSLLFNLLEGLIRIAVFFLYLVIISFLPDVRRFYQYHGAEHKSIFAFEDGEDLDVANARRKSRLHPRCGTSFLMTVMVVAILAFSLTPHEVSIWEKALWRLLLIPVVAGLSFEAVRFSVRHSSAWWSRLLNLPGLVLQRLTTREPTDDQLHVALVALQAVDIVPTAASAP